MKKNTFFLSIMTGLVLVFLITVISAGCGKKTPSAASTDETASSAPADATAEPSSQPLSSSEPEISTGNATETEAETATSPLPTADPTGWTGGAEMTVAPEEEIELTAFQDKNLAGIRNYRWLEQPYDSTHWTIIPKDMEILHARCDARTLVMQGDDFDGKLRYTLAFRMLEQDEDPRDYQYYPINLYYTYQRRGYTIDRFDYQHQWPQSVEYFGAYEDFIGFTTKFSGDVLYCEDEEDGKVIVDQAYIAYNPGSEYHVLAIATIETTKEIYDRLTSGKLEIDDEDTMLYALFEGAAERYPDVTYPLARYLTVDVFDDGTRLFWDWIKR